MGRMQDAVAYFQNALNLTVNQAAGIVGNLFGESGLNHTAVGDNGAAYGLAQWHSDRQANFKKVFGKDIRQSTYDEQLQFVTWELQNTEKKAHTSLLGSNTIAEATSNFMKAFERPAAWAAQQSLSGRIDAANKAADGNSSDQSNTNWTDWLTTQGFIKRTTGIDASLSLVDLFNGKTASRWTSVIIGIILISLAIAAFIFLQGNDIKNAAIKATVG